MYLKSDPTKVIEKDRADHGASNRYLIPRIAISEVALVPGSNPMFGLNTLGGAVSIGTKDGRSQPGTTMRFRCLIT
jgi:hypothetical protein